MLIQLSIDTSNPADLKILQALPALAPRQHPSDFAPTPDAAPPTMPVLVDIAPEPTKPTPEKKTRAPKTVAEQPAEKVTVAPATEPASITAPTESDVKGAFAIYVAKPEVGLANAKALLAKHGVGRVSELKGEALAAFYAEITK